ncbi:MULTISPECIES: T9SS type A sorting domain-containing protein [Chryseobacterium]|uniref:T9SS type A sorting domain-containing protein n=1 Tax=Chryseobacterium TaxID=59732 RepID=UPI000C9DD356|nr:MULTISPECIES: T9SS type A sorting domain-containing protein [Chryseobacterium]VXB74172.1 Por secretion system C-terminal sorting domain-containing protein [Chryseobacterium sp. 8AT]
MMKTLFTLMVFMSFGAFNFKAQIQKISFENSEGYTVGNLGGQQGWTVWGGLPVANAQVVNSNPTDGTRSFNMISNGLVQDPCGIEKNITSLVTSNDVEISFDYNFAGLNSSSYEIAIYNNALISDYTAAFQIDYLTGTLSFRTNSGLVDGPVLTANQWHNLKMIIKQSDNTLKYFTNGTQIYSGALGTNKNVQAIDFVYDDYGTGFRVDNIQINNLPVLSTDEVGKKELIKIYPNPTAEILNIETDSKINSIAIFDAKGSLIKNFQETGISNGKRINVSDLVSGIYMLKVKTSTSEFTKKFVKK